MIESPGEPSSVSLALVLALIDIVAVRARRAAPVARRGSGTPPRVLEHSSARAARVGLRADFSHRALFLGFRSLHRITASTLTQ